MADKPQLTPWEAELAEQVLQAEYAQRGEEYPGTAMAPDSPVDKSTDIQASEPVDAKAADLSEAEQERLARQFAADFKKQAAVQVSLLTRLKAWLATNEGRVVVITVVAIIVVFFVFKLLGLVISNQLSAGA